MNILLRLSFLTVICQNLPEMSSSYKFHFSSGTIIYGVNLRIQSESRKIRTRKNSAFGHFSRSESVALFDIFLSF